MVFVKFCVRVIVFREGEINQQFYIFDGYFTWRSRRNHWIDWIRRAGIAFLKYLRIIAHHFEVTWSVHVVVVAVFHVGLIVFKRSIYSKILEILLIFPGNIFFFAILIFFFFFLRLRILCEISFTILSHEYAFLWIIFSLFNSLLTRIFPGLLFIIFLWILECLFNKKPTIDTCKQWGIHRRIFIFILILQGDLMLFSVLQFSRDALSHLARQKGQRVYLRIKEFASVLTAILNRGIITKNDYFLVEL